MHQPSSSHSSSATATLRNSAFPLPSAFGPPSSRMHVPPTPMPGASPPSQAQHASTQPDPALVSALPPPGLQQQDMLLLSSSSSSSLVGPPSMVHRLSHSSSHAYFKDSSLSNSFHDLPRPASLAALNRPPLSPQTYLSTEPLKSASLSSVHLDFDRLPDFIAKNPDPLRLPSLRLPHARSNSLSSVIEPVPSYEPNHDQLPPSMLPPPPPPSSSSYQEPTGMDKSLAAAPLEPFVDRITLRALVSNKEAGVIIGKAGSHVDHLRVVAGVKAGVSQPMSNVADRVLTVTGTPDCVAHAYSLIAQSLVDSLNLHNEQGEALVSVRLLISHHMMGTVIGRQGAKIKEIQDISSALLVAGREMLPQSTERVMKVSGSVQALGAALLELARILLAHRDKSVGNVPYNPVLHPPSPGVGSEVFNPLPPLRDETARKNARSYPPGDGFKRSARAVSDVGPFQPFTEDTGEQQFAHQFPIPGDMVGCIIGKGGAMINHIRRLSQAQINIAREAHDSSGARMLTLVGSRDASVLALHMLQQQLEEERILRVGALEL